MSEICTQNECVRVCVCQREREYIGRCMLRGGRTQRDLQRSHTHSMAEEKGREEEAVSVCVCVDVSNSSTCDSRVTEPFEARVLRRKEEESSKKSMKSDTDHAIGPFHFPSLCFLLLSPIFWKQNSLLSLYITFSFFFQESQTF